MTPPNDKGKVRIWARVDPPVLDWWKAHAARMGGKPSGLLSYVATQIAHHPELIGVILSHGASKLSPTGTGAVPFGSGTVDTEQHRLAPPGVPGITACPPSKYPVLKEDVQLQEYWGDKRCQPDPAVNATVHRPPEPPPPGETKASPWATLAQDLTDAYSPGWDEGGILHPPRTFQVEAELGQVRLAADPRDPPEAILAAAQAWPSRKTNPGLLGWVKGRMWREPLRSVEGDRHRQRREASREADKRRHAKLQREAQRMQRLGDSRPFRVILRELVEAHPNARLVAEDVRALFGDEAGGAA